MKIIITGNTGFVGKNLMNFFNKKHVETQGLSLRDLSWKADIDKKADCIIHLAAKAHDIDNKTLEEEYFDVNFGLTKEVFDVFIKSDIKDFFFFSSVKAVADTVEGMLTEENQFKTVLLTAFGRSKSNAETYILNQKLPEGKRLFIIRPCMIHGPGNKGNLNLLYKIVEKGIPWPLAAFENQRSFLSIDNLSFLVLEMLSKPEIKSGIYNFADDEPISTNQLIKIIGSASGRKSKLWSISPYLIKGLAKIGNKMKLPLNSERLKKLTESYVVSNQKIKTALNINNLPLSAEEGLLKTIQSFKK